MTSTLLVPVKNEIEGLKEYVPQIICNNAFEEVIIIDANSTDGSREYASSLGCKIITQQKPGMRAAYIQVYESIKTDIIVVFSPDGNSLPDAIPVLLQKIQEGYDLVIASRYKDGAISYDDSLLSGIANAFFSIAISIFGFPYTDAMVMYRAYRKDLPNRLGLDVKRSDYYENTAGKFVSWEPLMSIRAAKASLKICEVGFDEPVRIDQRGRGLLLPATRISHFKAGFFCLIQLLEEFLKWNWKTADNSITQFKITNLGMPFRCAAQSLINRILYLLQLIKRIR